MSENNRIIKVRIFGEEYPIKGDFNDDQEAEEYRQHVLKIARYVDEKMHEMAEKSVNRSPKNIAVLTVLNIADELFCLKRERESQLSNISEKADMLVDRIDSELHSAVSG